MHRLELLIDQDLDEPVINIAGQTYSEPVAELMTAAHGGPPNDGRPAASGGPSVLVSLADPPTRIPQDKGWNKAAMVEVLVAYSHSAQVADLGLSLQTASQNQPLKRRAADKRSWSLIDRLDETQRLAIVDAYRSGATAAQLAATHNLSLSSLKRILRSAHAAKVHI